VENKTRIPHPMNTGFVTILEAKNTVFSRNSNKIHDPIGLSKIEELSIHTGLQDFNKCRKPQKQVRNVG
jgi:hypothetical protein